MRLLLICLVVPAALATPVAAQRADVPAFGALNRTPPSRCTPRTDTAGTKAPRRPSMKLGDQPPASHILAVYTMVDGCSQPIVLREGIGANPHKAAPVTRTPPRATNANR